MDLTGGGDERKRQEDWGAWRKRGRFGAGLKNAPPSDSWAWKLSWVLGMPYPVK